MAEQNGYPYVQNYGNGVWNEISLDNGFHQKSYPALFDYIIKVTNDLGVELSFYTIDFADVLYKVQEWRKKMPNIRPYYAVKTNSDAKLLELLVLLGFSFDCASEGEIRMVLQAGGDPKNIIFAHVIKTPGALAYALGVGVDFMTFDSEEELAKIHKHYPSAKLLLRLAPVDVKCSFDLSDKFGCEAADAYQVLERAKYLNMKVVGISFHVGGLCKNPQSFVSTLRTSRDISNVARSLGFDFKVLDIGGGFSGAKGTEELFNEITLAIKSTLTEYFPEPDLQVIAEPGTFFVASACRLTTAICGKKNKRIIGKTTEGTENNAIQRVYYLNDSVYGSFFLNWQQYGCVLKPLLEDVEVKQRPIYKSTLWGQTCCGEDLLIKECSLPDMEEGEFLLWENMGAYNHVICSTFCGVPIPATKHVYIKNPRVKLGLFNNTEKVGKFIQEECALVERE